MPRPAPPLRSQRREPCGRVGMAERLRLAVLLARLGGLALLDEHVAERDAGGTALRRGTDGATEVARGLREIVGGEAELAEPEQRTEVLRLADDRALVERLGVAGPTVRARTVA